MPKTNHITWVLVDKAEPKLMLYKTLKEIDELAPISSHNATNLRKKQRKLKNGKRSYENTTLGKLSKKYIIYKKGDIEEEQWNNMIKTWELFSKKFDL
tara:strand:- start:3714 stop:4007 length:294 start_codon:yes stop_codon:yes gene_type:complete